MIFAGISPPSFVSHTQAFPVTTISGGYTPSTNAPVVGTGAIPITGTIPPPVSQQPFCGDLGCVGALMCTSLGCSCGGIACIPGSSPVTNPGPTVANTACPIAGMMIDPTTGVCMPASLPASTPSGPTIAQATSPMWLWIGAISLAGVLGVLLLRRKHASPASVAT